MVFSFFDFCISMHMPELFNYNQMTAFFEFYLMDREHTHSSLANYMAAWRDYAEEHLMYFPPRSSVEHRQIQKYIRGAQLRYPHEPRRCTPATLDVLGHVADALSIYVLGDYFTCSLTALTFMCRILVAHDACMRVCEHSDGCRLADVSFPAQHDAGRSHSAYLLLHVGRRVGARKIKRRPARTCILPVKQHRLSAGRVLQILIARVHSSSLPNDVLFPRFFGSRRASTATPWARMLRQLRHLLGSAPSRANIKASDIEGRSLRAGGATDWLAAGASGEWLAAQGGWLSSVYMIYNRPTDVSRYVQAPQLMGDVLHVSTNLLVPRSSPGVPPAKRPRTPWLR